ncbi:MAG TPA: stage V sporulation protein AD [Candidatus Gallacutalibacter stercoravium]|nr:stage V sporulation protein AD [Candidatus Gallacutalibacter stercoravium]
MAKRVGRYTLRMENKPSIVGYAAICGKKEGQGPLSQFFDKIYEDTTLGESSWEKAESRLQTEAVTTALRKARLQADGVDYIFAGDLLNQCISSTFGLRSLDIPFLGQYGACSTMAQTLALSSIFVDSGAARRCVAVTSSHFCTAERQFRFPLEYGGQRTPTAQWTVTGSGAAVVDQEGTGPYVQAVTIGRIVDLGIKDAANMGAAMAPAAATTLLDFFHDTGTKPEDYDLILTGDLGQIGSDLLYDLTQREGVSIGSKHKDCGLLIFDRQSQDVHAGGSGCGCAGSVLCSYILNQVREGTLKNILFMATGALMSTTSSQQGESIPGVAHLVQIKSRG